MEINQSRTWATEDGLASFDVELGQHNIMDSNVTPAECLLRAWYFTLSTMSSVGYGDILPRTNGETLLQLLVVMTGACLFAAVVGSIGVLVQENDDKSELEFRRKNAQLKKYFEKQQLPRGLVHTIQTNFVAMWTASSRNPIGSISGTISATYEQNHVTSTRSMATTHNGDTGNNYNDNDRPIFVDKKRQQSFIRELPIGLRAEIAFEALEDVVHKIHYLRNLSATAQRLVALEMRVMYCIANTPIYKRGDQAKNVFFVYEGEVSCSVDKILKHINPKSQSLQQQEHGIRGTNMHTITSSHIGCFANERKRKSITKKHHNDNDQVVLKVGRGQANDNQIRIAGEKSLSGFQSKSRVQNIIKDRQVELDNTNIATNTSNKNLFEESARDFYLPSMLLGKGNKFRRIREGYHFGHEPWIANKQVTKEKSAQTALDAEKTQRRHHIFRCHDAVTTKKTTLYMIELSTLRNILESAQTAQPLSMEYEDIIQRLSINPCD
jgi:hypothetical protein